MASSSTLPTEPGTWLAVDLDGTLTLGALRPWDGSIGAPRPGMVQRVREWIGQGLDVRIFTARVGHDDTELNQRERLAVEAWCQEHIGHVLPVTATKQWQMCELWDDRARHPLQTAPPFSCGRCGIGGEFYEDWHLCEDCADDVYGHGAAPTYVRWLLRAIGEDPKREGLLETPRRVARAFKDEFCSGYGKDPGTFMQRTFPSEGYAGIVLVRDIAVVSLCEHHMLPFTGVCHCAYIPGDRIVGLSKFARVVDAFSRRLQVQERLTKQIADCIQEHLKPKALLVNIAAEHSCMVLRGVQKPGALTVTSEIRGLFLTEPSAKAEVFQMLQEKGKS